MSDATENTRGSADWVDRSVQHEMLGMMRDRYPDGIELRPRFEHIERIKFEANAAYLKEHGLCETHPILNTAGRPCGIAHKATARGVDFLEQDGGLSAILGIVTIKMHADTLRDLIAAKVDQSAATPAEKHTIKERLASLSEDGLRAATTDLVQEGLRSLPDALGWIGRYIGM